MTTVPRHTLPRDHTIQLIVRRNVYANGFSQLLKETTADVLQKASIVNVAGILLRVG